MFFILNRALSFVYILLVCYFLVEGKSSEFRLSRGVCGLPGLEEGIICASFALGSLIDKRAVLSKNMYSIFGLSQLRAQWSAVLVKACLFFEQLSF